MSKKCINNRRSKHCKPSEHKGSKANCSASKISSARPKSKRSGPNRRHPLSHPRKAHCSASRKRRECRKKPKSKAPNTHAARARKACHPETGSLERRSHLSAWCGLRQRRKTHLLRY